MKKVVYKCKCNKTQALPVLDQAGVTCTCGEKAMPIKVLNKNVTHTAQSHIVVTSEK